MNMKTHDLTRNGVTWRGTLSETGTMVSETVSRVEADGSLTEIHDTWFNAKLLGDADRDEYLRVMTASVVEAEARAARTGQSLRDTLAGTGLRQAA